MTDQTSSSGSSASSFIPCLQEYAMNMSQTKIDPANGQAQVKVDLSLWNRFARAQQHSHQQSAEKKNSTTGIPSLQEYSRDRTRTNISQTRSGQVNADVDLWNRAAKAHQHFEQPPSSNNNLASHASMRSVKTDLERWDQAGKLYALKNQK